MNPLASKRILLGVTGSIAVYKAADLASKLHQSGAEVDVILTAAAQQFLTPLTFQSVTGRRAYTEPDMWGEAGHILHIGLAEKADLFVIAPATANTLAKLAHGQADNLLTVAALANRSPMLVAPAMDGGMWDHPATQANIETLRVRGTQFIGPNTGHLASGQTGLGRMAEPAEILGAVRHKLAENGPLSGTRVLVSAGGTHEAIDPVRMISNRSSGKQGFALAWAALDMGAEVTLVAGPSHLPTPYGARRINVTSSQEMLEAVQGNAASSDVLVMAAAVADFRPANIAADKIKKGAGIPEIILEPAPDILGTVGPEKGTGNSLRVVVGFAAESRDLIDNARGKLDSKNLDLIVANDIRAADAGFGVDTNRVTLLFANGKQIELPLMGKDEVAVRVMMEIHKLLENKNP